MRTWHDARREVVTASDAYCLFEDVEPGGFKTLWSLYYEKRGELDSQPENNAMRMGTLLEPIVLQLAQEQLGCEVHPWDEHSHVWAHESVTVETVQKGDTVIPFLRLGRIGSTPDAVTEHGAPVEAKTTSEWSGDIKFSWALQLTIQMRHLGADHGYLAVLVQGRQFELCRLEYDPELYAAIEQRAERFWQDVASGNEPKVDWSKVGRDVRRLHPSDDGQELDDPNLEPMLALIHEAKRAVAAAKSRADALEAELLHRLGSAAGARAGAWKVSAKTSKPSPGTLITADMVGTYVGARAGFRSIRITPPKEYK